MDESLRPACRPTGASAVRTPPPRDLPETDVFDLYVTPSWEGLCSAVKAIKVSWKGSDSVAQLHAEQEVPGSILAAEIAAKGDKQRTPQLSRVTGS
jgi:hypothetical protein